MIKNITLSVFILIATFYDNAEEGIITLESNYSVKDTADKFEVIAKGKGLTIFTRIDHQ